MSESNKIKAVLVELTQNDRTETVDGAETVKRGVTLKCWYVNDEYPKEILDYGTFWEERDRPVALVTFGRKVLKEYGVKKWKQKK